MTDDELWDALNGLYSYDTGCVDFGIHDEYLRDRVIEILRAMSETEFRLFMSKRIRESYLSDEALTKSYGIEDVARFIEWLDERMDCSI